jgi:hypothetical protein
VYRVTPEACGPNKKKYGFLMSLGSTRPGPIKNEDELVSQLSENSYRDNKYTTTIHTANTSGSASNRELRRILLVRFHKDTNIFSGL